MPKFKTDLLDQYCYEMFGHTNWGYENNYDKKFIKSLVEDRDALVVVFFKEPLYQNASKRVSETIKKIPNEDNEGGIINYEG